MTTTFKTIEDTASPMLRDFASRLEDEIPVKLQSAAAFRFADIAVNNFGFDGEARPKVWKSLSKPYADEFHGGARTPTLILSGDMQESIRIENELEKSVVVCDSPYAEDHQEGVPSRNLPARPFFPMTEDGEATEYAQVECLAAAGMELERILNEL